MGMANVSETRKIMTKPLPEILDEIEESLKLADAAAVNAREAAVEARIAGEKAAEDARKAGEKAAREARKAGEQAAIEVRKSGEKAIELATLTFNERIDKVEQTVEQHVLAINERIDRVEQTVKQTTLTINERIDKVEQIANKALQLAELLKLSVTEGVVTIDRIISGKTPDARSVPKK